MNLDYWFMGSQRVRHDWVTGLNWTELNLYHTNLQGRLETGSKLAVMYWILVAEIKGRIFVSMGTDPLLHFSKCQGYIWKVIAIFSHFIKIIPCLHFTHKNLWLKKVCLHSSKMGFPGGASGKKNKTKQNKNMPTNVRDIRDLDLIPGSGRSPGGGQDHLLHHSRLENPMDKGDWQATVHRVTESRIWLNRLSTPAHGLGYSMCIFLNLQIWGKHSVII